MDVFQFFTYLKQFNADVLLVGAAVWALDLLLGKTLLKNAPARVTAFLPFLGGAALYAAYAAATGGFANGMTADEVISAGITCGSLATVINVVCGKLTSDKGGKVSPADCVKQLLAGARGRGRFGRGEGAGVACGHRGRRDGSSAFARAENGIG